MPIPKLSAHGLLPKGIHDCSMEEIAAFFSSRDSRKKRARLFKNLEAFVSWITPLGCFRCIYIDGSFVTDKATPGDVDIVLELPPPHAALASRMHAMQLLDQAYVHKAFGVHAFFYVTTYPGNDLRAFFQYLRPDEALTRGLSPGETKGILRVSL